MTRRKLYNHIISTDSFGIKTKIHKFTKPRVTKASKNTKVTG